MPYSHALHEERRGESGGRTRLGQLHAGYTMVQEYDATPMFCKGDGEVWQVYVTRALLQLSLPDIMFLTHMTSFVVRSKVQTIYKRINLSHGLEKEVIIIIPLSALYLYK